MQRYILVVETKSKHAGKDVDMEIASVVVGTDRAAVKLLGVVEDDDRHDTDPSGLAMMANDRGIDRSPSLIAALRLIADVLEDPDAVD